MIGPMGRCQSSRRCKVTSTLSSTARAVASSAVPRSCGEGPLNSATMAGPPGYPGPVMPGQVKLTNRAMTRPPGQPRRSHVRYQYQHRNRPHTRTNPGRQYGPHPRHAAGSIGVKFCAAPAMLLAPREVCASAVSAADPANSNAIARVSETLRISFLLRFAGCDPLGSAESAHFIELVLLVHANIADCPSSLNAISKPLRAEVISSRV